MNVIAINGSIPNQSDEFNKATQIIYGILAELGIEIEEVNLAELKIPYYTGTKSGAADDIIKRIEKSKGVIFLSSSGGFAPSALIQTFLEHFEIAPVSVLREKNCMIFAVAKNFAERPILDYFSRFLNYHGAYDSTRIVISSATLSDVLSDTEARDIIEKCVEDYYRLLRQNRKFFIPRGAPSQNGRSLFENLTPDEAEALAEVERRKKIPASEIYKKLDLESFTKQQEDDINDLAQYFAGKNTDSEPYRRISEYEESLLAKTTPRNTEPRLPVSSNVLPRAKTCKQMTQSLPHYFQPQLAGGLNIIIQIHVSGIEKFDGYLKIANNECEYFDGTAEAADVTIIADSNIWTDVMKNKYTAQKAFMIGHLKVRGNFIVLTKFDQFFKPL